MNILQNVGPLEKRVSLGREANKNDEEEEAASKEEVWTRVTQISYCCSRVSPVLKIIRKINCQKVATVTPSLSPPLSLSLRNLPSPRALVYAVAASQLFFVFLDRTCCIVNLFPDFSYA